MIPLATPRFYWLVIGAMVMTLSGAAAPPLVTIGAAFSVAIVLAYIGDRLLLVPPSDLDISRDAADALSLGRWSWVRITMTNPAMRNATVRLRDEVSPHVQCAPAELRTVVPERSAQTVQYAIRSTRRGRLTFGVLTVRCTGPLGLAERQLRLDLPAEATVYPDITALTRYDLALRRGALQQFGLRPSRLTGEGQEFDRLREYVVGDDSRHLDWKATAKRHSPITREYATERSQQIVILVDAGRLMTARVGEYTKLDYAINAALLLAHVSMRHGDKVGVLVFAERVLAYLPPGRGAVHLAQFLSTLVYVEPRLLESNYVAAFNYLAAKTRRRTLVAAFTDLVDADASAVLLAQMRRLRPRHLPLCVTMRDADIDRALQQPIEDVRDVYRRVAAGEVQDAYDAVMHRLTRSGALVVNVGADSLSTETVNRYLEVKARGLL